MRPPWEPRQETSLDLVIDPGRAFGTGAHATTRLCLELLLDVPVPSTRIAAGPGAVDLGCGSGVLAIAAAKLGWPAVLALDYDPLCVDATIENAARNDTELHGVRRFDLREQSVPPTRLVLANLLGPLLVLWADRMGADGGKRPLQIIASGLLTTEADQIAAAFAECGYAEARRLERGEWAALLMESPDRG